MSLEFGIFLIISCNYWIVLTEYQYNLNILGDYIDVYNYSGTEAI